MKVTLKTMTKEEHVVEVEGPDSTVAELRAIVVSILSVPADKEASLIHLGKVLNDDETMSAYGIAEGALIVVVLKKAKSAVSSAVPAAQPAAKPAAADVSAAPTQSTPQPPAAHEAPAPASTAVPGEMIALTVADLNGDVRPLQVEKDETVGNVKAVLEVEFGVPTDRQQLHFEGKLLTNEMKLSDAGVKNNDMLMMQAMMPTQRPQPTSAQPAGAGAGAGGPGALGGILSSFFNRPANPLARFMDEAQQLLQAAQADPHFKLRIRDQNEALAKALDSGNPEEVAKEIAEIHKLKRENEQKKAAAIMRLNANPLDIEAQKEIEEAIRMENVNANLETAMEYNPESFARVVMLYVDSEVNGVPVKAFVDSGAQSTIMSQVCAERLGLMRLIDYRYAGIAKGVGTSKIIGRVHAVQMKIGKLFFTVSITVLEDNSMEFLFGLDNLRRHQMCIDLKDNVLRAGEEAVPFLGETDIPSYLREQSSSDKMQVEDGAQEAAKSGGGGQGAAAGSSAGDTVMGEGGGAPAGGSDEGVPEEAVQNLVQMGFTRQQAVMALKSANGNAELAASLLFGGE